MICCSLLRWHSKRHWSKPSLLRALQARSLVWLPSWSAAAAYLHGYLSALKYLLLRCEEQNIAGFTHHTLTSTIILSLTHFLTHRRAHTLQDGLSHSLSNQPQQELQGALKTALATPAGSKSVDPATLTSLADALGLMLEEVS